MNPRPLLALAILLASTLAVLADDYPENLQLFLLIGQSNMAGRGKVDLAQEMNPRIFMLKRDLQWTAAQDPVHFDKAIAGAGLCSEFARVVSKARPQAKIGLIPCAMGGSALAEWKPGAPLYHQALERTRAAMKNGTLAGILWHQGESDVAPEKIAAYGEQFAAFIAQLRQDLEAPNVPLIVGELGRFEPTYLPFNAALPGIVAGVPRCALVSSEDQGHRGDKVHFDTPALRKFGERYAAAYLKMAP